MGFPIVPGARSLVTPLIQPLFVPFLYFTLTSLGTIFSVWTNSDRIQDESDFLNQLGSIPYDFIIVGAGSAGCLLANRLSRRYTVLLIEAGGEPNPLQYIPAFSLFFPNIPEADWGHRTVPQKYASLNSVNRESSWSTGLGLGGTGTLNYMIHLRGHRKDFDNWAKITGDSSWSWEGVLPYFKRHENYEIPGDKVNHGYRGDLRIERAPDLPRTARDFVNGGVELGYPNVDLNAPFNEGFDIIRYPMRRGVRQAPFKAFLEPVRHRITLTIMKFAQVTKILFKNGNEAYGVDYDRHGKSYVAYATREVIVSCGAVGTPKVLMLSGIGPKPHLTSLNIPVISDVPVGKNLQDHIAVYLGPFFIRPGAGFYLDRDLTIGQFIKWFTKGRGRLSNSGCEATGLFCSSFAKARGEGDWPDIHLISYGLTMFRDGAEHFARIFNLKFDEMQQYYRNDVGRDSLFIGVSGARPFSRGYIQLGGSSPYDKLIIDPNYLGDPEQIDLKVLLEAVKKTVYLMENTTAIGVRLQAEFTTERLPGCEHLEFRSDAYWTCYIRRYTVTLHHPVGTASMGSVVDTQLRVFGTKNLRVIDASVQPQLVTTNTQASTLMIAEKGADMILKYWKYWSSFMGGGNKKIRPFLSLFGGGRGPYRFGAVNNLLRRTANKKMDVLLNASEQDGLNKTKNEKKLNLARHEILNNVISEQMTKEEVKQSLRDLKVMGKLGGKKYDGHFNGKIMANSSTVTPSTSFQKTSTSEGSKSGKSGDYGLNEEEGNTLEDDYYDYYYYDDDDDDQEENSPSREKPAALPVPPQRLNSSLSPQNISQEHHHHQQHGVTGSVFSSAVEKGMNDERMKDGERNIASGGDPEKVNSNSLDDIKFYKDHSQVHQRLNGGQ